MELFLEIADGPDAGTRVALKPGLTLGRAKCDLNIQDSKVSGKHARVETRDDGLFWLVDTGSSNGIKLEGKRVREVRLDPETVFRLGRVSIRVVTSVAFMDSTQPEIVVDAGSAEPDSAQPRPQIRSALPVEPKPEKTWVEIVRGLCERAAKDSTIQKREIEIFENPFRMKIKRGLQAGTEWTIGYGPRDVGRDSVDLSLLEKDIPNKCFRLVPKDKEVMLKVYENAYGKVTLNGKRVETSFLSHGDSIEVGETTIEFNLEETKLHVP